MSAPGTTAWRPVVGYPNYEVSDDGQVRSRPRERSRGGILKPARNPGGYWYVTLCRGPEKHRMRVHQLVAEAFIGPCPPGQEVRHLDDNKDDNRVVNLAYGTRQENVDDAIRNARLAAGRHNAAKTHCPREHPYDEANTVHVRTRTGVQRVCRACRNARARGELLSLTDRPAKPAPERRPRGPRTHCRRNHELTPENAPVDADGRRRCRKCVALRYEQRKLATAK